MDTTTWPADVIARYLTVGGATADITQAPRYIDSDELLDGLATCTGCGTHKRFASEGALERNTDAACRWAQSHAETCRAMPKPAN